MQAEKKKSKGLMVSTSKSFVGMPKKSNASMKFSRVALRKQSYGFRAISGIKSVTTKGSDIAMEFRRPVLMFLNTYQLEPRTRFNVEQVTKAAEALLDSAFTGHKYNSQESPALAIRVAGEMMRQVKEMYFDRYRIIAVVTVGQKRSQSYNNAIAFLWDHVRDNYVNVQREVTTALIQVTIFGIYLD